MWHENDSLDCSCLCAQHSKPWQKPPETFTHNSQLMLVQVCRRCALGHDLHTLPAATGRQNIHRFQFLGFFFQWRRGGTTIWNTSKTSSYVCIQTARPTLTCVILHQMNQSTMKTLYFFNPNLFLTFPFSNLSNQLASAEEPQRQSCDHNEWV